MKQLAMSRAASVALLALLCAFVSSCAGVRGHHTTTSVVDYLYPDAKEGVVADQGIPVLTLPMRVGIAFVPEKGGGATLSEAKKTELLQQVADHFRKLEFIQSLEIIPSAYLTPRGGFQNLEQIRALHGIESIVLVSYDQKQFTDEGVASLVYWTIVGAYVIPGEKNSTYTMVDAVVMHIPSRKLLFRAPGTSQVKGYSTPVNLSEELRRDSEKGFEEAVKSMIPSLEQQLALFQEKVKASPEEYQVVRAPGARGGGALEWPMALVLALMVAGGWWWARRR
ncbi:MAG TPA: rhombotarget lipoprotein [Burkholderiales bacterium]|jgi:rhombotail lipoprotein|nr:rhombotarget lipoprotein [Burkholderiales bacterium]